MKISHPNNTASRREDLLAMLSVCDGDVFFNVVLINWRHLTDGSCEASKERFCPQAHQKSHACVHAWDRIGWLAWRRWPCIPVMHSRWTPGPSCKTTGKPLVLPVSHVWPTGIRLALRQTCHQHAAFLSSWFQVLMLFSFAINLPNLDNKHMSSLWLGPVPGSHERSLQESSWCSASSWLYACPNIPKVVDTDVMIMSLITFITL